MILFMLSYVLGARFSDAMAEALLLFAFAIAVVAIVMGPIRVRVQRWVRARPSFRATYIAAVREQQALEATRLGKRRNVLDSMPARDDRLWDTLQLNRAFPSIPSGKRLPQEDQGLFREGSRNDRLWNRFLGSGGGENRR